jgi:hypothetical protein
MQHVLDSAYLYVSQAPPPAMKRESDRAYGKPIGVSTYSFWRFTSSGFRGDSVPAKLQQGAAAFGTGCPKLAAIDIRDMANGTIDAIPIERQRLANGRHGRRDPIHSASHGCAL